ncbi:MAG: ribosomal protection-like ABC-F family protein [Anaerolineae bacterium]
MNVDKATVAFGTEPVFQGLSWRAHDDRVVGLVGPNGSGKTSLLRLIAGELDPDGGSVVRRKGLTIGYLEQEPRFEPGRSVMEEALSASVALDRVERDMARIEERLADPDVYGDESRLTRTMERQARTVERYTELGGPGYEGRVRATVRGLGFTQADLDLTVEVLSGGQRKLLGLAKLLVTEPDVLLLDEPDNDLDLEGKAFLERYIRSYRGGVILVSHDRYLLDLVVDEIVELEDGRLTRYRGNYSEYAYEKQLRLARQQDLFQAQQRELIRLEQAAKRLLLWGQIYDNPSLSRRGKSILKRLDRVDRIERPILERREMGLELRGWRGSSKVLEIVNLAKSFSSHDEAPNGRAPEASEAASVLKEIDLTLWHGERVGMIGPNGAGKSLLFRLILDQEPPTSGRIKIGPSVRIGYYAQQHETLDYGRTLVDTVRLAATVSDQEAVRFLARFLFTYEQARGPVSNLSGGERSRLQMALLMLSDANFLLLDEPTNNLDIASIEVLETAVADFQGTVFVISHDRYFLDRTVDRIVELDEGTLAEYLGGYSAFEAAKAQDIET